MTDPLSLIALGAAVGGSAGKFAEKAWDSAENWLKERFGSHSQQAQQQARENAASFVRELGKVLADLETQHRIESSRVDETAAHPQFSALLQRTVINAAQTDDTEKQELLATLVAARLTTQAETTLSLASSMASDAIARSTKRQIELMALLSFILEVRPKYINDEAHFRVWIQHNLRPFNTFEFHNLDARHLVAIACATYNPESQRNLNLLLAIKGGPSYVTLKFNDIAEVEWLEIQWDLGLAGVSLTSVGSLVGAIAFDHITGSKSGLPVWND